MEGECRVWTGNLDPRGYGRLNLGGKLFLVHRLSKALADGTPYADLHIHHICRNKACLRPDHLQPITAADHRREHNPEREVCERGHSMTDAYPRPDGRGRQCRACIKIRTEKRTAKQREERASRPPLAERPCCVCGKAFRPAKLDTARYCSQTCRVVAFMERNPGYKKRGRQREHAE